MMPRQPFRVLQLVPSANPSSGVRSVVTGWHQHIDRKKVQFDYLYVQMDVIVAQDDICNLGGHYYVLPSPYKHPLKFLKESCQFFKTHRYYAIHSHFTNLNFFFFPLAKLFGTQHIIQHAHGTKWSDKKLNGWRNYLMLHAVWPLITHKLACSQAAGKFWYGKNFTVVNNGIDAGKFAYNPAVRAAKRKELGLENNFVIGNIGRFALQKNHAFLIEIFKEVVKQNAAARLVLVGGGPLETKIKSLASAKQLTDKILFLGVRKDVKELYQAFDVLCMPSLYEGLPVVGVEAQAAGVPGVFADTITPEVLLLPQSCSLSLKNSPAIWAEKILSLKNAPRSSGVEALRTRGFDIRQTARQIQDFYLKLEK